MSSGISASGGDAASKAQEQATLRQLVSQYRADVQQGQKASSLQSLASKINADARQVGQSVTLPTASGGSASPPPPVSSRALDTTA